MLDQRAVTLGKWLNACLAIVGKAPELCRFLGLSPEFIGITIVKEKKIEAYETLFTVEPMVSRPPAPPIDLPCFCLLLPRLGFRSVHDEIFVLALRTPLLPHTELSDVWSLCR